MRVGKILSVYLMRIRYNACFYIKACSLLTGAAHRTHMTIIFGFGEGTCLVIISKRVQYTRINGFQL